MSNLAERLIAEMEAKRVDAEGDPPAPDRRQRRTIRNRGLASRIYTLLNEHPEPMSSDRLSELLDVDRSAISGSAYWLVLQGQAEKVRTGVYRAKPRADVEQPAAHVEWSDDLGDLEPDEVVYVLLDIMFPHGLHVRSPSALLKWRDATVELIRESRDV